MERRVNMKKLLAVLLSLLVVCTAFSCCVFASAADGTAKNADDDSISQLITDVAGNFDIDAEQNRENLHNGFKFFRILLENMNNFFRDIAEAFDRFADRWRDFNAKDLFGSLSDTFKG